MKHVNRPGDHRQGDDEHNEWTAILVLMLVGVAVVLGWKGL